MPLSPPDALLHAPPDKRVLVAEDDALVAMHIEQELDGTRFDIVGAFDSCAATEAWLQGSTPDVAIIDLELRDGPCTIVAKNSGDGACRL